MKISINHLVRNYTDLGHHTKETSAAYAVSNTGHKFDAITIQSNPRQIEERTFAEAVSRQLSAEVSNSVSEEKVNLLKAQVTSGAYQIDAHAIASNILLLGEV